MLKISDLVYGNVYSSSDIHEAFKCSTQGGMLKSNTYNTLVIIASHHKSLYDDVWNDDIMHYTGMGQEKDQDINYRFNKTLAESNINGITVHLFESYIEKQYIYDGIVKLVDDPYEADELDKNSEMRKVIKFPIRIVQGKKAIPTQDMLDACKNRKAKIVSEIPDDKLKNAAKKAGSINPKKSSSMTTTYDRDLMVSENTKRRAKGICDLCGNEAPFNNKEHKPYLECHHVVRLADGGPDMIYNTVALCPNCHRRIHVLNDKKDRKKLIDKIGDYVDSLGDSNITNEYKALFKK